MSTFQHICHKALIYWRQGEAFTHVLPVVSNNQRGYYHVLGWDGVCVQARSLQVQMIAFRRHKASRTSFPWGRLFINAPSHFPPGLRRLHLAHLHVTWPIGRETTPAPTEPPPLHPSVPSLPPLLDYSSCTSQTSLPALCLFPVRSASLLFWWCVFFVVFFVVVVLHAHSLCAATLTVCTRRKDLGTKKHNKNRRSVPVRLMYLGKGCRCSKREKKTKTNSSENGGKKLSFFKLL